MKERLNEITEEIIGSPTAVHEAQLLSYPKLSGHRVGLLINFNVRTLKQGIRRMVNELHRRFSLRSLRSLR